VILNKIKGKIIFWIVEFVELRSNDLDLVLFWVITFVSHYQSSTYTLDLQVQIFWNLINSLYRKKATGNFKICLNFSNMLVFKWIFNFDGIFFKLYKRYYEGCFLHTNRNSDFGALLLLHLIPMCDLAKTQETLFRPY
jgi:hypothetical protein